MHFLNLIHWILLPQMWPHVNPIQRVPSRVGTLLMYLYECSFNSVYRYFHQWPTHVSWKYAFLVIWHYVIYSLVKDEWMNANIVYHTIENIIYATVTSFAALPFHLDKMTFIPYFLPKTVKSLFNYLILDFMHFDDKYITKIKSALGFLRKF